MFGRSVCKIKKSKADCLVVTMLCGLQIWRTTWLFGDFETYKLYSRISNTDDVVCYEISITMIVIKGSFGTFKGRFVPVLTMKILSIFLFVLFRALDE